jgi:hypothetical protein
VGVHHVFACGETFAEHVTLPSGIDLWGGRTRAAGDWLFGGPDGLTTPAPESAGVPLRVTAGQENTSATNMHSRVAPSSPLR